eukprot:c12689_g1_i1.p1 GENE.c12689_g1_i1~~c12689_g1_i1.p1  ORF type:complete len:307 (+),score=153.86 c12689_g1_i1:46-921(+)
MAERVREFGLDRELAAKQAAKYDPALEEEARKFVSQKSGVQIPSGKNCLAVLKDGVALCKMINALRPGSVKKINENKMAFMQMENIASYLSACESYGVEQSALFQTVDLYEERNMNSVVTNILAVARKSGYVVQSTGQTNTVAYEAAEKAYTPPPSSAPTYKASGGVGSSNNSVPLLQQGSMKAGEAATKGAFGPGKRDIKSYRDDVQVSGSIPLMAAGEAAAGEAATKGAFTPGKRDITSHKGEVSSTGSNTLPLLQQGMMDAGEKAVKGAHGPGMRAEIVKTNNINYGK